MSIPSIERAERIRRGIRCCRRGEWHSGLAFLRPLVHESSGPELPGLVHAWMGQATARCERRFDEALAHCGRGLSLAPDRAEAHLCLAWVHLLRGDRREAVRTLRRGLRIRPDSAALNALLGRLGRRRRRVLSFLPRAHALNRALGRLRHELRWKQFADSRH